MPGRPDEGLAVLLGDRRVGTLAETPDGLVVFQIGSASVMQDGDIVITCV